MIHRREDQGHAGSMTAARPAGAEVEAVLGVKALQGGLAQRPAADVRTVREFDGAGQEGHVVRLRWTRAWASR